jgi:hypothetical protein
VATAWRRGCCDREFTFNYGNDLCQLIDNHSLFG